MITVGNERFRCPELLFQPSHIAPSEGTCLFQVEWQRLRLLWIGRLDAASALHGLPEELVRRVRLCALRSGVPHWYGTPLDFRAFRCWELDLRRRTEIAESHCGVHEMVFDSIMKCDPTLRKVLESF